MLRNVVIHSLHTLKRSTTSSSSARFLSISIPESIRDTVKSTLLDQALDNESHIWISESRKSEGNVVEHRTNGSIGGVNEPIQPFTETLDEWNLEGTTKYWPGLPSNVSKLQEADPFELSKPDLSYLSKSIREDLLGTDHPVLNTAASYFFESSAAGKQVRPMMVLLLSRALAESHANSGISDRKLVGDTVLTAPVSWQRQDLPDAQRRLAEISEIIHTASLFHDDVIDEADTRRGVPSVHSIFGNKVAILAGDYLLARASICLARLRDPEVIETMSTIIEHLVRGEIMQLRGIPKEKRTETRLTYYLRKNYYKTASLMANSCKSVALLGNYPRDSVMASYKFGKHLGVAFQMMDDVLDFEGDISQLGKPALSDLKAGIATAPVLFACEQFPQLDALIERKFSEEGDVEQAKGLVFESSGIERAKEAARVHAEMAMDSVMTLGYSKYRDALVHLSYKVVTRSK